MSSMVNPLFVIKEIVPDWELQLRRGFDGFCTTVQDTSDPLLRRLIPRLESQQQAIAVSIAREKEIAVLGIALALITVPFFPIFSILFLPAVIYGLLGFRHNRTRAKQLSLRMQLIYAIVLKRHEVANTPVHSTYR